MTALVMPTEKTADGAPRRRAGWQTIRGGKMEEGTPQPGTGHAWIHKDIVTDPTISPYAFRIYAIVRLHDYGAGAGCFVSRQSMARMGGMSERKVIYALAELRDKGYITTETSTDGQSKSRHFVTDTGACGAPPTPKDGLTGAYSAPGGACGAPEGVHTVHPEVDYVEVCNLSIVGADDVLPVAPLCADAPQQDDEHEQAPSLPVSIPRPARPKKEPPAAQPRPRGAEVLADALRTAMGCKTVGKSETRTMLAGVLRDTLGDCTPAEHQRFVRWFVSNKAWTAQTMYMLSQKAFTRECEAWLEAGKPETKASLAPQSPLGGAKPPPASASWRSDVDREIAARTPTATTNAEFDRLTGRTPRAAPGHTP